MGVHCLSSIILSLLVLSIAAVSVFAVDVTQINKICEHEQDSEFCSQTLIGDPGTAAADIDGLMLITIPLTLEKVHDISNNITFLRHTVTDSVVKERLISCQENYVNAQFWFQRAYDSGVAKSYYDIFYLLRKGWFEASVCENGFKFEPVRTSPLTASYDLLLKHVELTYAVIQHIIGPSSKLQEMDLFKPLPAELN
ncbi:pectinesterase inhibitor 5-like [Papaver somniferum]|uniref:pectinesterase inhibitor 5-like n=1 Tax=Papaver somniferum TaxID=3469 RepID=UPI000E700DB4|nr:pectinesterase inhibitor 5-like [Papaver somniferum]